MKTILEYIISKSTKRYVIKATDKTLNKILDYEVKRLGFEADLNHIDTSQVTNMKNVLSCVGGWITKEREQNWGNRYFNCDISGWNVSNVVDMCELFSFCGDFNQDISSWDVRKVKNMYRMFYGCVNFNQPLNKWDVSSVISMHDMFGYCNKFNQPLDKWDVSNVENMRSMFVGAKSFNQDISMWNVKKITKKIQKQNMFAGKCPIKSTYMPKFKIK